MFCPKCGAKNLDDAKFCRACGADIRLVPQALTGRVARGDDDDEDEDAPELLSPQASVERGVRKLVFGVGYLIIFLITMFYFREFWWATFWFIFPAVSKISAGAGILARAAHESRQMRGSGMTQQLRSNQTSALPRVRLNEVAPANTAEIVAPPASVTEGTTRHLDAVEPVEREDSSG